MNDWHLEKAFGPVPPMVHNRVTDTLREVQTMNGRKARPMAAIIAAALLLLGLMGAALAAFGGGVLNYLFGQAQPTPMQQESTQPLGVSHTGAGVTTTLTDCLYDGIRLSCGVRVEADGPLFAGALTVHSGQEILYTEFSSFQTSWINHPITGQPTGGETGFMAVLNDRQQLEENAPITVEISYYVPEKEVRAVPMDEGGAWQEQVDELYSQGYTVLATQTYDDGYISYDNTWPSRFETDREQAWFMEMNNEQIEQKYMNLKELDRFTLPFFLDTSRVKENLTDITPDHVDHTARFAWHYERVWLTPLTTAFRIRLTLEDDSLTWRDVPSYLFSFYDQDREPLDFQPGEYDGGCGVPEGEAALLMEFNMPALATLPREGIYIVPYDVKEGEEHPDWENAVYVPLAR